MRLRLHYAVCGFEGCGLRVHIRGLCCGHNGQRVRGIALKPLNPKCRAPMAEVFWDFVAKSEGCWEWIGTRARPPSLPYGLRGRKGIWAHRYSWELHFGPIPKGLFVLHRCDNPPCVRPDHLFLGTLADNARDRNEKWRHAFGTRHHRAKLTDESVRLIRERRRAGVLVKDIAEEFGVAESTAAAVGAGKFWKHVQ